MKKVHFFKMQDKLVLKNERLVVEGQFTVRPCGIRFGSGTFNFLEVTCMNCVRVHIGDTERRMVRGW